MRRRSTTLVGAQSLGKFSAEIIRPTLVIVSRVSIRADRGFGNIAALQSSSRPHPPYGANPGKPGFGQSSLSSRTARASSRFADDLRFADAINDGASCADSERRPDVSNNSNPAANVSATKVHHLLPPTASAK